MDNLDDLTERLSLRAEYDNSGNLTYFGQAAPGTTTSTAGWQILKCTYNSAGDITTALWADGNTAFDNVWDQRASLSYS